MRHSKIKDKMLIETNKQRLYFTIFMSSVLCRPMGPLQLAVTWYKIRHAGEQAVHWDIQNKATSSRQICIFFVLDVPVRSLLSARRILYHVTASCKGPIHVYLNCFLPTKALTIKQGISTETN